MGNEKEKTETFIVRLNVNYAFALEMTDDQGSYHGILKNHLPKKAEAESILDRYCFGIYRLKAKSRQEVRQMVGKAWAEIFPFHPESFSLFITPDVYKKLGEPDSFSFDMMNGLKIRVPETDLMVNTMKALNASATPIAYAELYTSLQSGVVDGAENGVTSYMDNSFNEVAPYFITDAHTFGCGVILVSADTWNSLTEEEQGWMKEAALEARTVCFEYNQKQEQACFDSFPEKGIKRLEVTDIEKWQEACAPLYAQQSEQVQSIIARIQGGEY